MTKVDNDNNDHNPVGRFMVAVGAVIANPQGQILLARRADNLDWRPGDWEICYGRIAQFEDPTLALVREVQEELGIRIAVGQPLRVWHIFRGHEKTAYNDLVGITFTATTTDSKIRLSDEHSDFRWASLPDALSLVTTEGIVADLRAYQQLTQGNH